ncbi:hypothetical protein Btru_014030 [Bulinus truncatus]|nr:hypothetical protein Btru_014030 [Bulinus truncatus]
MTCPERVSYGMNSCPERNSIAQFSYIAGSLHHHTGKALQAPVVGQPALIFWCINIALVVMPQLFAWWCRLDAEHFGRSFTVELSTPIKLTSKRSLKSE